MPSAMSQQPFVLLREIELRSREKALGLPQKVEVRQTWSGIGFRVNGTNLISGLEEVNAILELPPMTKVPGALPWVKGVANIRGTLLPILDLKGFIDGEVAPSGRRTRIIVISEGELSAGLVVDEVVGMRHFFDEEFSSEIPDVPEEMKSYLAGAYRQSGNSWAVFSMRQLAESHRFIQVAVQKKKKNSRV